jgi:hypothetical protein
MESNSHQQLCEINFEIGQLQKELKYSTNLTSEHLAQMGKDTNELLDQIKQINAELRKLREENFSLSSEITRILDTSKFDQACREEVYTNRLFEILQSVQNDMSFLVKIIVFISAISTYLIIKFTW